MINHLTVKNVAVFAGCLVSIAAIGAGFTDWAQMQTPSFVFGCVGVVGTHILAAYGNSPSEG